MKLIGAFCIFHILSFIGLGEQKVALYAAAEFVDLRVKGNDGALLFGEALQTWDKSINLNELEEAIDPTRGFYFPTFRHSSNFIVKLGKESIYLELFYYADYISDEARIRPLKEKDDGGYSFEGGGVFYEMNSVLTIFGIEKAFTLQNMKNNFLIFSDDKNIRALSTRMNQKNVVETFGVPSTVLINNIGNETYIYTFPDFLKEKLEEGSFLITRSFDFDFDSKKVDGNLVSLHACLLGNKLKRELPIYIESPKKE